MAIKRQNSGIDLSSIFYPQIFLRLAENDYLRFYSSGEMIFEKIFIKMAEFSVFEAMSQVAVIAITIESTSSIRICSPLSNSFNSSVAVRRWEFKWILCFPSVVAMCGQKGQIVEGAAVKVTTKTKKFNVSIVQQKIHLQTTKIRNRQRKCRGIKFGCCRTARLNNFRYG